MRIFDIGPTLEKIETDLQAGLAPDPALVNLLIEDGPVAVEEWLDMIANVEAEQAALDKRIEELEGRRDARKQTVKRMKEALQGVLLQHFSGKVKTAQVTAWVQDTVSYDYNGVNPEDHPQFYKTEVKLDKKSLNEAYKNSASLPSGIEVVTNVSQSLRTRR